MNKMNLIASLRLCVFAFTPTSILLAPYSYSLHHLNAKPLRRKDARKWSLV
jgi:hypothetical protein